MTRKTRPQEARTESLPQRRVLVLHGPNLNLLSSRDPISGEQLTLAHVHGARYSELLGQFQRQVNAAYVDPDFIARVRKKLDLDQRQAAEIFGGGVNAFSRYENGKTKPPLALVKLLKVLVRHPGPLNEIRAA